MGSAVRYILLVLAAIGIIAAVYYLESLKVKVVPNEEETTDKAENTTGASSRSGDAAKPSKGIVSLKPSLQYEVAKEISSPDGFINVDTINIADLIGKQVIMVDFWTYSCINCQRTLPYLNQWHDKYGQKGLTIIGVHTPEFEFEKKIENVQQAVDKYAVEYPVVLDNDFSTWRAYRNRYWPRKYLIDIYGNIVYDHIGEGGYKETEAKIQELLRERQEYLGMQEEIPGEIVAPVIAEQPGSGIGQSPEIYFGSERNTFLGNGKALGIQTFKEPETIEPNKVYLVGTWSFTPEYAENITADAKVIFRYRASKVFTVAAAEKDVTITLLRDGKSLGKAAGKDTKEAGGSVVTTVKEEDLYRLIEDPDGFGEHTLEMRIGKPGLKMFTFTFG